MDGAPGEQISIDGQVNNSKNNNHETQMVLNVYNGGPAELYG